MEPAIRALQHVRQSIFPVHLPGTIAISCDRLKPDKILGLWSLVELLDAEIRPLSVSGPLLSSIDNYARTPALHDGFGLVSDLWLRTLDQKRTSAAGSRR